MVILYEPFGGLSNRLFQHIHFNSFCKHNNITFINNFLDYGQSQPASSLKAKLVFEFRKILSALNIVKLLDFNDEQEDFSKKEDRMRSGNTNFVKGWCYRNKELTIIDREYYRNLFYPGYDEKNNPNIDPWKINIAVHIRRGDYAGWQDGKYYFNDDVYINAIDSLIKLMDNECKVLIFTNDHDLNRNLYHSKYKNIYISSGDEKTDHYLMSKCRYIIGPPSSFSMWASYIGNAKFYHLKSNQDVINLSDFEICNG